MTKSQKMAIGYAIRKREHDKREKFLKENGFMEEFKHSKYKSMLWFLRSKGINPYSFERV